MTGRPSPPTMVKKRNSYYKKIYNYKVRREELKKRFPPARLYPLKHSDEYKKKSAGLTKKIKLWQRQIKKIDMITNKIYALGNLIAIFLGYNVKDAGKLMQEPPQMFWAKCMFYKMGHMKGIQAKLLREYAGAKRIAQPKEYRDAWSKLLMEDKKMLELWHRFKKFYNEFPVAGSDFIDNRTVKH